MDSGEISYDKALARRRLIEVGEPPKYHAVDALAHNELCISMGHKVTHSPCHIKPVRWYHRLTANFYHWPNIAADIG